MCEREAERERETYFHEIEAASKNDLINGALHSGEVVCSLSRQHVWADYVPVVAAAPHDVQKVLLALALVLVVRTHHLPPVLLHRDALRKISDRVVRVP
jgi:hypothetical protein